MEVIRICRHASMRSQCNPSRMLRAPRFQTAFFCNNTQWRRTSNMIKSALNQDGTVALSIGNKTLSKTTQKHKKQIERLGRIRAQMNEQVPSDPPLIGAGGGGPAGGGRAGN